MKFPSSAPYYKGLRDWRKYPIPHCVRIVCEEIFTIEILRNTIQIWLQPNLFESLQKTAMSLAGIAQALKSDHF